MALNLSTLTDYVNQNSRDFVLATISEAKTAKLLQDAGQMQVGIKGKEAIQVLSTDVNLQDGSGCGRTPSGDTTFSQKVIEVFPLKDEQNYCPKAFEKKWMSQYLTAGQTYNELLFADDIMSARASKIGETNEKAIWQGDTASTDINLNKYDGFLKQINVGAKITLASTGVDVLDALQKAFLSMPAKLQNQSDLRIFIGEDTYSQYLITLANKNIFKETDVNLYGTNAKLEPVAGLNGTNKVVIARLSNLVIGTDLLSEEDKAELVYSIETKQVYIDFHYALGVVTIFDAEIGLGTISIVDPDSIVDPES